MRRLTVLLFVLSAQLWAQDIKPVVAVLPFEAVGVGADETKTVENLVQSYVSEMSELRLVTSSDRDRVLKEQEFSVSVNDSAKIGELLAANFLLSGSVGAVGEERVLTLELIRVNSGEKKSFSLVQKNMSELVLGARSLVLKVFNRPDPDRGQAKAAAELKAEDLVGSWKGDKGIELVRVFRGGRALAVFSSGAQMELAYRIEGAEAIFVQTSPNAARYYLPLPYAVAQAFVKVAKPMEWRFSLFDGASLKGTKTSTAVSYTKDEITSVSHDASRPAEWTKADR